MTNKCSAAVLLFNISDFDSSRFKFSVALHTPQHPPDTLHSHSVGPASTHTLRKVQVNAAQVQCQNATRENSRLHHMADAGGSSTGTLSCRSFREFVDFIHELEHAFFMLLEIGVEEIMQIFVLLQLLHLNDAALGTGLTGKVRE